jgi:ribosomal protein S18 acetylase RimI-like enzyme
MTVAQERVDLRPMQQEEFAAFREAFVCDWARDIARIDDLPIAEATAQAAARTDADLPDGAATKGHFLFVILRGKERVGTLWFSVSLQRCAFLNDITVEESSRGRGYGPRALDLLEVKAQELGLTWIDLHAYAHNSQAIDLYRRLGYRTTGLKMRKMLGPRSS